MIFRLRDFVFYPLAIRRFGNMLTESQYWTPSTRRAWVQGQLSRTLDHAVRHVPYYKRTLGPYAGRFNEMIDRLDLSELPLLTKEMIRSHYQELCAENCQQYRPAAVHTSGSTGTPTQFLLDRSSNASHFASIWRVLNWAGYRFGNRFADLTGHTFEKDRLFEYDIRLNCLYLSSFNFKKENIPLYINKLTKFNPVLIKAYPSALDLFCRWLREAHCQEFHPQAVLTCAESLLDHQRLTIEETLQCPVFDFYNQNERAALFSTCEKNMYHIHEEYSHVELVKTDGESSDSDPSTEIVTTSLHNFAMPLIRYRTDDLASLPDNSPCSCGRTYKIVKRIIGRIEDIVITPDGRHVGRLDAAFKYSPGIRLSQVIQERTDEILINIVKAPSYSSQDEERLLSELRARVGHAIGIKLNFVDTIPVGTNGKLKFVISSPGKQAIQQLRNR
jgi:phenylacetate-CoA ligase